MRGRAHPGRGPLQVVGPGDAQVGQAVGLPDQDHPGAVGRDRPRDAVELDHAALGVLGVEHQGGAGVLRLVAGNPAVREHHDVRGGGQRLGPRRGSGHPSGPDVEGEHVAVGGDDVTTVRGQATPHHPRGGPRGRLLQVCAPRGPHHVATGGVEPHDTRVLAVLRDDDARPVARGGDVPDLTALRHLPIPQDPTAPGIDGPDARGDLAEVDGSAVRADADALEVVVDPHPVHDLRLAGQQREQRPVGLRALLELRGLHSGEEGDVGVLDVERARREALRFGRDGCRLRGLLRPPGRRPGHQGGDEHHADAGDQPAQPAVLPRRGPGSLLGRTLLGVDRVPAGVEELPLGAGDLLGVRLRHLETGGQARARPQGRRLAAVGVPLGRGDGEPALHRPACGVLHEPPAQAWPLPEEGLVGDLDRPVGSGQEAGPGQVLSDRRDPLGRQRLELAHRHPPAGDAAPSPGPVRRSIRVRAVACCGGGNVA